MALIDTHAHLNMAEFDNDREEVIKRANENSVKYIVNIGYDIDSSRESVELADKYNQIFAAIGVHPHDAKNVKYDFIDELSVLLNNKKVVAIGEIGLDYYRNISPPDIQKEIFRKQLEFALSSNMPVIIHSRDAEEDTLDILENYINKLKGGIFHAFSGSSKFLTRYLDTGFYFGIGGVITFKNANNLRTLLKRLPIKRLVVETDSPYLTPIPYRGKRNEPSYVIFARDMIGNLLNIEKDRLDNILFENSIRILEI